MRYFVCSALILLLWQAALSQSVYDGFSYPPGQPLQGQGGIENGWGGPWIKEQGDDIFLGQGAIDTLTTSTQGNHLDVHFQQSNTRYKRAFYEAFEDNGFPIWISFLMDFPSETTNNNVGQITLLDGNKQVFSVGRKYGSNLLGFHWDNNVFQYNSGIASEGGLNWIVIKIVTSGTPEEDEVYMWVNPDPRVLPDENFADLKAPSGNLPKFNISNGFDAIRIKAEGTASLRMLLDELYVGHDYPAVSPLFQASVSSDIQAYEPFDYPTGSQLEGAGAPGFGWRGPWQKIAGTAVQLDGSSLQPSGWAGKVKGQRVSMEGRNLEISYERELAVPIADDGREVWFSCLMDFKSPAGNRNQGQLVFTQNGTEELGVGIMENTGKIGFFWEPNVFWYESNTDAEGLHWIVGRIKTSGGFGGENAWLWIDPSPRTMPSENAADIVVPQANLPSLGLNDGIDAIRLKLDARDSLAMEVDEIRLGRSFEEVSPFELTTSLGNAFADTHIQLFPQPVKSHLQLRGNFSSTQSLRIKLEDMQGRILHQEVIMVNSSVQQSWTSPDISHWASGAYMIIIESKENRWTDIFSKQ